MAEGTGHGTGKIQILTGVGAMNRGAKTLLTSAPTKIMGKRQMFEAGWGYEPKRPSPQPSPPMGGANARTRLSALPSPHPSPHGGEEMAVHGKPRTPTLDAHRGHEPYPLPSVGADFLRWKMARTDVRGYEVHGMGKPQIVDASWGYEAARAKTQRGIRL